MPIRIIYFHICEKKLFPLNFLPEDNVKITFWVAFIKQQSTQMPCHHRCVVLNNLNFQICIVGSSAERREEPSKVWEGFMQQFMWDWEQGSIFMEIWAISFPCQDLKAKYRCGCVRNESWNNEEASRASLQW